MKKNKIDTKHFIYAVCHLNVIAVRIKPEVTEMLITQLLFGETCQIIEKKNKYWFKIKSSVDETIGWIQSSQIQLISDHDYKRYGDDYALTLEVCQPTFNEDISKFLVIGSRLPLYDGISCTMPDGNYVYNGLAAPAGGLDYSTELFVKVARRYLYSPELNGGKSPFGMDALHFVHQVFRFFAVHLPNDISALQKMGEAIDFIEQAREGDIAFCSDDKGNIIHAGIIIGEKKVIHVNGRVRIDKIDHYGIFQKDLHKYTHKLRIIKRIFPSETV
ncbi:MAG: C40 family peptidase [Saprospiraceae bacterium]|nr:C40 family peptidase [Saprospiraceae bacterium]